MLGLRINLLGKELTGHLFPKVKLEIFTSLCFFFLSIVLLFLSSWAHSMKCDLQTFAVSHLSRERHELRTPTVAVISHLSAGTGRALGVPFRL